MKRIITLLTIGVLLTFVGVFLYFTVPSFRKVPYAGKAVKKAKNISGLMSMFERPSTLVSYTVYMRFHENGKWQAWQQMLLPLHREYLNTGNFSSLLHCYLDLSLMQDLNKVALVKGVSVMKTTKPYVDFKEHIFYTHKTTTVPDSLEFNFCRINRNTANAELLLTFKDTPR